MKDLANLVNNYKPITEHKDEVVIDDFAKSIIDRVFNNLAIIFPAWKHNWKSDDPNDPDKILRSAKREWTKAFVENNISTMEQISYGFKKARQANTDFLPSCGKFISWCNPSPEDLGFPSEISALELCITHRNKTKMGLKSYVSDFIIQLVKNVDWWMMNNDVKKSSAHFKEKYLYLIANYEQPEESQHERLETKEIVKDRMSPEQLEDGRKRGLDALKDIKRKLKAK